MSASSSGESQLAETVGWGYAGRTPVEYVAAVRATARRKPEQLAAIRRLGIVRARSPAHPDVIGANALEALRVLGLRVAPQHVAHQIHDEYQHHCDRPRPVAGVAPVDVVAVDEKGHRSVRSPVGALDLHLQIGDRLRGRIVCAQSDVEESAGGGIGY